MRGRLRIEKRIAFMSVRTRVSFSDGGLFIIVLIIISLWLTSGPPSTDQYFNSNVNKGCANEKGDHEEPGQNVGDPINTLIHLHIMLHEVLHKVIAAIFVSPAHVVDLEHKDNQKE